MDDSGKSYIEEPSNQDEEKAYQRKPYEVRGTRLLVLAFSTLGIIYSDIGTTTSFHSSTVLWSCFGIKAEKKG